MLSEQTWQHEHEKVSQIDFFFNFRKQTLCSANKNGSMKGIISTTNLIEDFPGATFVIHVSPERRYHGNFIVGIKAVGERVGITVLHFVFFGQHYQTVINKLGIETKQKCD